MFGFGDQWETSALTPLWNNVNIVVDKILPGHTRGFFLGSWKDGWALALYQSTTTTTIKCKDSKYLGMVLICLYVCIVFFFFFFGGLHMMSMNCLLVNVTPHNVMRLKSFAMKLCKGFVETLLEYLSFFCFFQEFHSGYPRRWPHPDGNYPKQSPNTRFLQIFGSCSAACSGVIEEKV